MERRSTFQAKYSCNIPSSCPFALWLFWDHIHIHGQCPRNGRTTCKAKRIKAASKAAAVALDPMQGRAACHARGVLIAVEEDSNGPASQSSTFRSSHTNKRIRTRSALKTTAIFQDWHWIWGYHQASVLLTAKLHDVTSSLKQQTHGSSNHIRVSSITVGRF